MVVDKEGGETSRAHSNMIVVPLNSFEKVCDAAVELRSSSEGVPPPPCLPPPSLPLAYCPLPTAYCPLPTAHCPLPTAYYPLPTAYCLLPTAYCPLPTAYYPLPYPRTSGVRTTRHAQLPVAHPSGQLNEFRPKWGQVNGSPSQTTAHPPLPFRAGTKGSPSQTTAHPPLLFRVGCSLCWVVPCKPTLETSCYSTPTFLIGHRTWKPSASRSLWNCIDASHDSCGIVLTPHTIPVELY